VSTKILFLLAKMIIVAFRDLRSARLIFSLTGLGGKGIMEIEEVAIALCQGWKVYCFFIGGLRHGF